MNTMTNFQEEERFIEIQEAYLSHLKEVYRRKKAGQNIDDEVSKIRARWTEIGILDSEGCVTKQYEYAIAALGRIYNV